MKKIFFLTGILFIGFAFAKPQSTATPDIVVVSKLDSDWSRVLVTRIRKILSNFQILDPFKYSYDGDLGIGPTEASTILPASSKRLVSDLGTVVGLDFLKAQTLVSLHGFAYEVRGFKTDLKAAENIGKDLIIKTGLSASEISVQAGKITLSVQIPAQNGKTLPAIAIDIVKPVIEAKNNNLMQIMAKLRILDNPTGYGFKIEELNMDQMAKNITLATSNVKIDYEDILIPKVALKVGDKTINFSPDKIRSYLRAQHEGIKGLLLSQLAKILRVGTADAVQKLVQKYEMPKNYWLMVPKIKTSLAFTKISNFPVSNTLQMNLDGDFCPDEVYVIYKDDCVNRRITKVASTRLTPEDFTKSLASINDIIQKDGADLVASVSEDYLNKLLATTIDAGLWNEALKAANIELGPKKVMLRLDHKGQAGTFVLDGIYRPRGMERIATGVSVIRFPLVLSVGFRIEEQNEDEPILIVKVIEPDTSDDILLKGLPQYGFDSNIGRISRFRGKVIAKIRDSVRDFVNKDIVILPVPELRGLNLDQADFQADGNGRLHGSLKLEDFGNEWFMHLKSF